MANEPDEISGTAQLPGEIQARFDFFASRLTQM